ncbi:hypothetical protein KKG65_02140 [Patescibacteria group bacterium]|nr:hypothetical protein [Patescibacteria group bacterium]MBU1200447.1 hypothetical protein [Patescibacteria group bacterium]
MSKKTTPRTHHKDSELKKDALLASKLISKAEPGGTNLKHIAKELNISLK